MAQKVFDEQLYKADMKILHLKRLNKPTLTLNSSIPTVYEDFETKHAVSVTYIIWFFYMNE